MGADWRDSQIRYLVHSLTAEAECATTSDHAGLQSITPAGRLMHPTVYEVDRQRDT